MNKYYEFRTIDGLTIKVFVEETEKNSKEESTDDNADVTSGYSIRRLWSL